MLWQNSPSVIIGRNQNAHCEVDREYIQNRDIKVIRRISGGGAVYNPQSDDFGTFVFEPDYSGCCADFGTAGENPVLQNLC